MRKIIIILISLATCINTMATNYFLTEDRNFPRPGDRLTLCQMHGTFNINDTLVIDLSLAKQEVDYCISYNQFKDSLLVCTQNREAEFFAYSGDSILLVSHRKPGLTLDYIIPETSFKFPLLKGEKISGLFFAEGTRAMHDYARISGTYFLSGDDKEYTLITPEADTIANLFHTKYVRKGSSLVDTDFSRSYKSGNTTIISSDSIMWHLERDSITHYVERHCLYAQGYRYPLFETRLHKVLYYGIAIDTSFVALYCAPGSQAHDLASDPANEELRIEEAATSFRSNFGDVANIKSRNSMPAQSLTTDNDDDKMENSLIDDETCEIDYTGEATSQINISYSTRADCVVAVTLHNSGGALMWHTSEVAYDSQGEISYPTRDLVAGEYLVTVFLKKSQYTFKFIKK